MVHSYPRTVDGERSSRRRSSHRLISSLSARCPSPRAHRPIPPRQNERVPRPPRAFHHGMCVCGTWPDLLSDPLQHTHATPTSCLFGERGPSSAPSSAGNCVAAEETVAFSSNHSRGSRKQERLTSGLDFYGGPPGSRSRHLGIQ